MIENDCFTFSSEHNDKRNRNADFHCLFYSFVLFSYRNFQGKTILIFNEHLEKPNPNLVIS